jgi:hypothetical protein
MTADGRIGWPDVVQYEMLDGPDKGRLRTCKPMVESDLDPRSTRTPTASERCSGRFRGWEGLQRRGYPYRTVVHDEAAYDDLVATGAIYDPRHTGAGRVEDHRDGAGG